MGNLGYPEHNGNCHRGSNRTGYSSFSCCPGKETKQEYTWCLKKNIGKCFTILLLVYSNHAQQVQVTIASSLPRKYNKINYIISIIINLRVINSYTQNSNAV